jgi:primase-polymerase (primpol)-like protein
LRIWVACPEFAHNRRMPSLEVYSHSRFLTVTGRHVEGTPEAISSVPLEQLEALIPDREKTTPWPVPERIQPALNGAGDLALWEHIFVHDSYGEQHLLRFDGDTSLDGGDHSLAVIRLLNCLARWTGCNATKMRAMMLLSPLANEKWYSKRGKGDWLDHQIADAIRYNRSSL